MNINVQYKDLLEKILKEGYTYEDKSRKVLCKQISSHTLNIDLTKGFPAITLKNLYWKGVVGELLWFLRGSGDIRYLWDNNITIWDKDWYNYYCKQCSKPYSLNEMKRVQRYDPTQSKECWNLGRVYGAQWKDWNKVGYDNDGEQVLLGGFDQISNLIKNLKENPMSRRHIVTAWNPAELDDMALPPCHWSFEIIVEPIMGKDALEYCKSKSPYRELYEGKLVKNMPKYQFTLKWHQRSVDTYLGLPFNTASYALLAHIIGKLTNMIPKGLIGDLSNVHLYENSWSASKELLKRDPLKYKLPELEFNIECIREANNTKFDMGNISDFKLKNYNAYPNIPVEMLSPKH